MPTPFRSSIYSESGGAPIQYIPSYNSSSYEWTVLQVTLLNLNNLDRCYSLEISNLYRGSYWTFPSYNTYCCTIYLYVGGKVIGRNVVEWNECLCPKKEDWKVRFLHPFFFWFVEGGTVQEHEASSFPPTRMSQYCTMYTNVLYVFNKADGYGLGSSVYEHPSPFPPHHAL